MNKNIWTILTLIFGLTCSIEAGISRVLISQDFENETVFPWAKAFDSTGLGDSTTTAGLWTNFSLAGNWTPKAYYDNSDFSKGQQCVNIVRAYQYGSGFALGQRTDTSISGQFISQICMLVPQSGCRFSLFLADAANPINDSGVGVCYFDGTLYVSDNQAWSARSTGVTIGKWFRIVIAGDTSSGTYKTFIDFGSGLESIGLASFNKATLQNIAGIKIVPWVEGFEIYFDDVILAEGSLPLDSCAQAYILGSRQKSDLNDDCYVNWKDLSILARDWMKCMFETNPNGVD